MDFEEYIRQGEPGRAERAGVWQAAIGLQAVDGLQTSEYLKATACRHIEGDISIDEACSLIETYYRSRTAREADETGSQEADKVSANITRILSANTMDFSSGGFISVHRRIFDGVFTHAGQLRKYNISKKEWVLDGDSVSYLNWEDLRRALDYDFEQERRFSYIGLSEEKVIGHLARFVSDLWQIHPFREGNTRTTAVFLIQYLRSIGFNVNNDLFARHSWYFRNALVRANYKNALKGVDCTYIYLELFLENLLYNGKHMLRNRYMCINPPEGQLKQTDVTHGYSGQVQDKYSASTAGGGISHEIKLLAQVLGDGTLSAKEMMEGLGLKGRDNFLKLYLLPAQRESCVEALYPDRPHHPRQKYRLTAKGRTILQK